MTNSGKEDIIGNFTGILPYIQTGFPITERPFEEIAVKAGKTEQEIIEAIRLLLENGVIRVFGPVFEAKKLGYTSTLVAAKVNPSRIPELAASMLDINEITHNYLRDNEFNQWFTITALTQESIDAILKWVEKFPGVDRVLNLPSQKVFKIKAVWGDDNSELIKPDPLIEIPPFDGIEKSLVKELQKKFPIEKRPFAKISENIGIDESTVINTLKSWVANGVIRRFGARLNHRRIGYNNNILVAWKTKEPELLGEKFSELKYVSHCYMRTPHSGWEYEVYTMIHSRSEEEGSAYLREMMGLSSGASYIALKTLYELKKTTMKYFLED